MHSSHVVPDGSGSGRAKPLRLDHKLQLDVGVDYAGKRNQPENSTSCYVTLNAGVDWSII